MWLYKTLGLPEIHILFYYKNTELFILLYCTRISMRVQSDLYSYFYFEYTIVFRNCVIYYFYNTLLYYVMPIFKNIDLDIIMNN